MASVECQLSTAIWVTGRLLLPIATFHTFQMIRTNRSRSKLMLNEFKLDLTWNKVFKKNGITFWYFGLTKPVGQFSGLDWAKDKFCQSELLLELVQLQQLYPGALQLLLLPEISMLRWRWWYGHSFTIWTLTLSHRWGFRPQICPQIAVLLSPERDILSNLI